MQTDLEKLADEKRRAAIADWWKWQGLRQFIDSKRRAQASLRSKDGE